eukprot:CAMPEP_0172403870 /NCGR_PEP_ID=MMETSP1061-20121228/60885_1 /TAXON_ID=37318 /ORGANISM="Pseudo-nitzschia pungens, Strain cf. pungens" /LENGTH=989 /DNA_ID=CAMNT_0013138429 /DNA_START=146 /DNA_END=3115 /DNA_ORIENTATION=+
MASQSFPRPRLLHPRKFHHYILPLFLCGFITILSLSRSVCEGRILGREKADNVELIDFPRGDFLPLKCNKRLDNDPCVTPWSKLFGNQLVFSDVVEIPCGKCVVMYPSKNRQPLTFSGGLRVVGKLIIHSNDILTTSILVHGELVIESLKPINGIPDVSITWIETASNRTLSFRAPEMGDGSNYICGGERGACSMGKKPFVVAGGKLDIRGLPSPSMPTWVPIYDVDEGVDEGGSGSGSASQALSEGWSAPEFVNTTDQRIYIPPKMGCPQDDILIHHNYLTPELADVFGGSYGSMSEWTPKGGLKITNRGHSQHCPVIDLKFIRDCLQPNKTYIITAKVLLTQNGIVDQTDCAKGRGDEHCMSIYQLRMSGRGIGRTTSLWKEKPSFGSMLGEETTISLDFNFTSQQISESNIYEVIQLRGPGPGVDMELLEFSLRAPPKDAFPDPENLCKDLVPANGNAELFELSPYPFRTNNEDTYLSVVTESSNRYFEVTGRKSAVKKVRAGRFYNAGITWDIPLSCIKTQAKYSFHADVRMHSLNLASTEWKVKASFPEKKRSITKPVATCPEAMGTWVGCDGEFEFSSDLDGAVRLEVFMETDSVSYDVDYDVDNLSFKAVKRSLDRLILPKSIENLWGVGSDILIVSHTSKWDGHATRTITSMENHDEEGYVSVGLNEAIDRPLTLGSHPYYATEVALLSRNIVFNGAGGAHLTVVRTPGQDQVIQGAEFLGFGEEGVAKSYPIHFESCADSPGSVVSKNTIRDSNQRCLVIDETNHMLIEGNIAFGNKGHCFVVTAGTASENVFKSNLGAFSQNARKLPPTNDFKEHATDDTSALFWIGTPSNHWVGNVASGTEGFGFWFQPRSLQSSFIQSPHLMPLTEFRDNVAHSTDEESLRITGYNPTRPADIIGFKSYLTNQGHISVLKSSNIAADETLLDTPIASYPFPMRGTSIISVEDGEEVSTDNVKEYYYHQSASNPTDVFNLQSSPSLLE